MSIGNGCTSDQVKSELAKVVQKSGGVVKSKMILECGSLGDAVELAKEWFLGHRCLFVWDDVEGTSDAPTGYVHEIRSVVDLIVGFRAIFSTRDRVLMNTVANPRDVVCVTPRSLAVSEKILCRHANISLTTVCDLRDMNPSCKLLKAFEQLVVACEGLPIYLAVTGRAIALKRGNDEGSSLFACKILDENETDKLQQEALETTAMDQYAGFDATLGRDWKSLLDRGFQTAGFGAAELRRMHAGLGALEKETWISASIAKRIWGIDDGDAIAAISTMYRFSLLDTRQLDNKREFRIQGLMHAYCERSSIFDIERPLASWHTALLTSYIDAPKGRRRMWWRCKDLDRYMRKNLVRHLTHAGLYGELAELLLDFRWIQRCTEVEAGKIGQELRSLEADYNLLNNSSVGENSTCSSSLINIGVQELGTALSFISHSIRLSRSMVIKNPSESSFQICGRLRNVEHLNPIKLFCESANRYAKRPMIRSIRQSLTLAGEAMLQSIDIGWNVLAVVYVPHSNCVIAGGQGGAIVIDLDAAAVIRILCESEKGKEAVWSIAIDRNGTRAVCGWTDGTVNIWDLRASKENPVTICTCRGDVVVTVTMDGKHVVTGSADGLVCLWDLSSGKAIGDPFEGHSKRVSCVAVSGEPRWIASGSDDNTVRIWDRTGVTAPRVITVSQRWFRCITWTPDMEHIVVGTEQSDIWICDVHGLKTCEVIQAGNWISSVKVTSDGRFIISACYGGTVQMWEFSTCLPMGEPLRGHTGTVTSVTVNSGEDRIVSASYDGTIKEWRLQPNDVEQCAHKRAVSCVTINAEQSMLASGSYDRTTRLWNMATGKPLHGAFQGSKGPVRSVAFTQNGCQIASGFGDGVIVIRDTASGNLVHEGLKGHRGAVRCLCFSPEGSLIATGSEDKTVMIWDCTSGRATCAPLKGHRNWVTSICFSSNGKFVASGSYDRTVRVWNSTSGVCVGVSLVSRRVTDVKFWEDDTKLQATIEGSQIQSWLLNNDAKAEEVLTGEGVSANEGERNRELVVKKDSLDIRKPGMDDVLAHFDYIVSGGTVYDNRHKRLWAGLRDGTVAAIELLD